MKFKKNILISSWIFGIASQVAFPFIRSFLYMESNTRVVIYFAIYTAISLLIVYNTKIPIKKVN